MEALRVQKVSNNIKDNLVNNASDLKTDITYWMVNLKKEITSITYNSIELNQTVTETFTYDIDNDIISIQLS